MIAILDYGSGNLRSAQRAFGITGHDTVITKNPKVCIEADGLVVPGVGAFSACMSQLISVGGSEIIAERVAKAKPIFGICVGMQVLFETSSEKGITNGLGIFAGTVNEIIAPIKPHMGWNTISTPEESKLFAGVRNQSFYFVHSFAAKTPVPNALNSFTNYGEDFIAAVESDFIVATQFHPEKSGAAGAAVISNWSKSL